MFSNNQILVSCLLALLSFQLNAADAQGKTLPTASFQLGEDSRYLGVGLGGWNDQGRVFSSLEITHLETEDALEIDSKTLAETAEYTSTRLALLFDSFYFNQQSRGMGGGFFLYSNDSEGPIERQGLGINLRFGKLLTSTTKVYLGSDLMPEFWSTDWNAQALLEYELQAGITQKVTDWLDLQLIYRKGGTWDEIRQVSHYETLMAGARLAF
ncbi:hypothetical protein [Marinospirillum perlucidum]|uniref:hypothetical protein n=1 Tax=Marinospirillum perlucidum TaxID=1982602 RepID=UPI000DF3A2F4|nr:hypothetical protein [Marinospirillum perlucidum]